MLHWRRNDQGLPRRLRAPRNDDGKSAGKDDRKSAGKDDGKSAGKDVFGSGRCCIGVVMIKDCHVACGLLAMTVSVFFILASLLLLIYSGENIVFQIYKRKA